jgi:hypothetical protein
VIPITDSTKLPSRFVPEVDRGIPDRVVAFWEGTGEEKGPPVLRRALGTDEKAALERRLGELRTAVAPAPGSSRNALLAEIARMLGSFPTMQRHDRETAIAIAAGYLWTARERPHWAIVESCNQVRAGTAGVSREFCPSEPVFNDLVGRVVAVYAQQLAKTEQLLRAKIMPPDPPRLSAEEIARKLGRPIGDCDKPEQAPVNGNDGRHMQRVLADLAARKAARAAEQPRSAADATA